MNHRLLILDHDCEDGEFSADVFVPNDSESINASLVFRYRDEFAFYSGGIGPYDRRGMIHVQERLGSHMLSGTGKSDELSKGRTYTLEVKFARDRFELLVDSISQCVTTDPKYSSGKMGLLVNGQNAAHFTNFRLFVEDPRLDELLTILRRFTYCLKREQRPRNEKDVQQILWTMLRARYDDIDDEDALAKFGLKNYRSDFGIAHLETIIEAKFHREGARPKSLQEQLMVDIQGFLGSSTAKYQNIVFFVYNSSGRALDSSVSRDLRKDSRILDLVEVFP